MNPQPTASARTFLFTDVVQSTALLQRVGDERGQRILGAHKELLDRVIATHGGRRLKWEGDGLMVTFLSSADAVRCAVAMQQAAVRPTEGERLDIRVGLHAGEALPWEEADYFGTPVVMASRLCKRGNAGQILCSAVVTGLLAGRRAFKFRALGSLPLKGFEGPVDAFEVLYERSPPPHRWTEEESEGFRGIAAVAVPARDEQIATILALLPFEREAPFRVVELGCGEGAFTYALLACFPNATVTALDGSESMRECAATCLRRFGGRAVVEPFELAAGDWRPQLQSADAVISSLVLHHLSDGDKVRLFEEVLARMSERGAFLIADVVEVQREEQRSLLADVYDRIAKAQSIEKSGSDELFRRLSAMRWNFFRYRSLADDEYPSPLFDQLAWLRDAGLEAVDCFWLSAGHAIYGGYKTRAGGTSVSLPFADALQAARDALAEVARTH